MFSGREMTKELLVISQAIFLGNHLGRGRNLSLNINSALTHDIGEDVYRLDCKNPTSALPI